MSQGAQGDEFLYLPVERLNCYQRYGSSFLFIIRKISHYISGYRLGLTGKRTGDAAHRQNTVNLIGWTVEVSSQHRRLGGLLAILFASFLLYGVV